MKKRLLMLFAVFMAVTSVGWLQAADIFWTVDAARTEADTQKAFKTLKAAVQAANKLGGTDKLVITVAPGDYNIERTDATTEDGNYLAITRDNVEIVGGGTESSAVKIYSSTDAVNGNWVDQNLITIHGDNVKIQNLTITCKKEVNKVIEVLGDHVTLNNLVFNAPEGEKFAGSIYFNSPADDTEKNIGTATLKNLVLNNGRITFTGAEKGTVNMENIDIYYNEMAITATSMSDLQKYTPFGAIANKPELTINATLHSVNVYLTSSEGSYKLDAATVANLPAGSILNLGKGEYSLSEQLVITKPLTLGGLKNESGELLTTLSAKSDVSWATGSKANLISIEGTVATDGDFVMLADLCVKGSKGSGVNVQSKMKTYFQNVTLDSNANAGLLVHSEVEARSLHTKDNTWGGVNVDKGSPEYPRRFTFDENSSFAEQSKIWSEDTTTEPAQLVEGPNDWTSYVGVQGASSKEMRYWTNSKLQMEYVTNFYTDKTLSEGYTLIYANGNPVTVEASGNDKVKISAGTNDVLEVATAKNPIIFGGAKFGDVESSNVTMKSGKVEMIIGGGYLGNVKNANVTVIGGEIINLLVGGGYGPKQGFDAAKRQTADITGKAVVKIENAKVRYLISAGLMYAKAKEVNVEIIGNNTQLTYILGGGYAPVGIGQTEQTDYATIANGVETTNFKMTNGKIAGDLFVGGGYSYSYSRNVTAILENVECAALLGTGSNGRSDNVKIEATGCKFVKATNWPLEIAAVNRGKVGTVSMDFKGCSFPEDAETKYVYLGATYQWQTGSYPVPTAEKISFSFDDKCTNTPVVGVSEGIQNVVLNGAVANVGSFSQKDATDIKDFTIQKGNVWALNKGLTIAEGCKLTNNGTLNIPAASIMSAIEAGGVLVVDTISTAVVAEMNKATSKADLSSKTFSIECKDGVIASNKEVAKELLKAGKVVKVLSFANDTYSIDSFQTTLAKITNLPDSVVFGTEPITLAFNLPGTEVSISGTSEVVILNGGVLTIKKPGTVTFELRVKKDTNGDGKIDDADKNNGNFTYDEDAANKQTLKVTKRKVTLTGGLKATDKTYDGAKTITLTKETLKFSGKLGDKTGLDLAASPTGELVDANAGENKEVIVTATLSGDSAAFYELAPITFVKVKVAPKVATVTAAAKSRNYGEENPEFTATTTDLVEGDQLDGILKFTCSATKDSLVKEGGYDIIPYGLTSDNYEITFTKGTLTVSAVNPVIELTEAKTVLKSDNSAKEIQLKAKLIHAGGAKAISSVKFVQGSTDVTATLGDDGFYTGKFDVSAGTTYSVKASATAGDKTGESKAITIAVDALTPQVVSFGKSVLPTMVYGNEMTLSATSDKSAATGAYTYSVAESDPATIADGKLKATGVGKVTLTVARAADATHSAAVATKTIEITPKPVTVAVGEITKVYDGTTAITTLPTFTLSGAANGVAVKTEGLTLSFASKNASESVKVLMPELTLTGTGADNYTLIQPTNVTGKITKAPLSVKVKDVTRMWNQRYTKYEFEATGLVNGETLSSVYTGAFTVTEEGTTLNLAMDAAKCTNYALTTVSGMLTVELGTPKAVVYGTSSDKKAMIVDEAGYTGLKASEVGTDGYANILDASGKVIGQSLNKISTSSVTASSFKAPMQTKAAVAGNWNKETFTEIPYGASYEVTKVGDGYTYESTNTNVLAVSTDASSGDIVCTPVATGKATILAISADEVKILNLEVAPADLTISATGMDKTYDGTTLASGTLALRDVDGKDVALDLSGITFNFDDKKAGENKKITPSQPLVLIGSEANNYVLEVNLTGKIDMKEVTVGTPLSAYYNGKIDMELTDYASNDRISGDIVPLKVTFGAATVGEQTVTLKMGTTGDAGNYTLATSGQPAKGNILKSTVVAVLPEGASSASDLKSKIKLTIRETGETVTSSAIGFNPTVTSEGSGSSAVYYVNGGETDNYSVVYDKNQIGFKSSGSNPPSGGDEDETVTISLDATSKTLPRTEEFVLKATVSPSGKTVTWSSSDPTIASVTADGNKATVKGLKVGTATITAKIGDVTATCQVTVNFATGLEEALANTEVFGRKGNIYVNPIQPLQVTVVNMIGKIVYNARISGNTQIPVTKGIYIVKLTNAGNSIVTKVNVY
ncbi:YDG domain-containing protein [uncultured Parabacteroides sp.]|uniref:YDG domain-containing protein n=1 Tax=uncultured Parabacteroides sp. TaxID=512312 RepID=UPI00261FDCE2|nr:YDG domain-containing protein [uncultured Parabacteroides sp.]